MNKRLSYLISFLLLSSTVFAQQANEANAVDELMHTSGKIYVVAACLVIIFVGIIIYLVLLDRKLGRLEKKYGEK